MSMPTFLTSSHLPLMPNGSLNEWATFFDDQSYELEANAFTPILWWLLYNPENIKFARYIDDYDSDNKDVEEERDSIYEEYGEQTYPYLVISQQMALKNLTRRKEAFLNTFGEQYQTLYDVFIQLIHEHYPDYILLRFHDVSWDENAELDIKNTLNDIQMLDNTGLSEETRTFSWIKNEMKKTQNLSYFFIGKSFNNDIKVEIPEVKKSHRQEKASSRVIPDFMFWIFAIIVGLPAVLTFIKTDSILISVSVFIVLSIIIGFLASKYEK